METPNDDYDNPWKTGLERYLTDFVVLFCPGLAREIDWSVEPEFRDQELRQVARGAKHGARRLDKLVRLQKLDGSELFIHIEVQLSRQRGFSERMFTCWSRLFDRYACQIVSVAVLGDRSPGWRPHYFSCQAGGTRLKFEFTAIKLLDYIPEASAQSSNFFVNVSDAHFATMATKGDPNGRVVCKILLTRRAYLLGWDQQRIVDFLNVLDWLMQLPDSQEQTYAAYLRELERRAKMPYVHSMVREGRQQGRLQGLLEGRQEGRQEGREEGRQMGRQEGELEGRRRMLEEVLVVRFGPLPAPERERLRNASHDELSRWARRALVAQTLAEVAGP